MLLIQLSLNEYRTFPVVFSFRTTPSVGQFRNRLVAILLEVNVCAWRQPAASCQQSTQILQKISSEWGVEKDQVVLLCRRAR